MKKLLLIPILLLATSQLMAKNSCEDLFVLSPVESFRGVADWYVARTDFSPLEMKGIELNAFEEALKVANSTGQKLLVYSGSTLNSSKYEDRGSGKQRYVSMTSRAFSLDGTNFQKGGTFVGKANVKRTSSYSALEILGIRFDAIADAIRQCLGAGHMFCVYQASAMESTNDFRVWNRYNPGEYFTSARAVVTGYSSSKNFTGLGSWHSGGVSEFTNIQVKGVEFSAIERAVLLTKSNGISEVAIGSLSQTFYGIRNDKMYTDVTATVMSLDGKDLSEGQMFSGEFSWNSAKGIDELDSLGVRKLALEDALAKCRAAGFSLCVYKGSDLMNSNHLVGDRYYTSAQAQVKGYLLK